jgi:hypothetical protein
MNAGKSPHFACWSAQEAGQQIAIWCATHALESPEGGLQTNASPVLELPNQDAGPVRVGRKA